jgi:hypothetical protein
MQGYAISRSTDEIDSKSNDRYAVLSSSLSIGFSPHRTTNAEIAGAPRVAAPDHGTNAPTRTSQTDQSLSTHWSVGGNLWGSVGKLHLHLDASAKLSDIIAVASTVPSSSLPSSTLTLSTSWVTHSLKLFRESSRQLLLSLNSSIEI